MLKALPGVERVRARASSQRIDVLYDTSKQDSSVMAQQLASVGYEAKLI